MRIPHERADTARLTASLCRSSVTSPGAGCASDYSFVGRARTRNAATASTGDKAAPPPHAAEHVAGQTLATAGVAPEGEISGYDGVKTFSATRPAERERLGDRITTWLRAHPAREVVATVVTQSSDERFHCVTLTLFWRGIGVSP
jgi:hypothetical protein